MKRTLFLLPMLAGIIAAADPLPPPVPFAPGDERSAKPTDAEWAKAERIALPRPQADCVATHVREWVRVACKQKYTWLMGARVVAGSIEDVSIAEPLSTPPDEDRLFHYVDVIFPARRGDRRLIEIPRAFFPGFKSYSIEEAAEMVISELWLPGDAAPTITVH